MKSSLFYFILGIMIITLSYFTIVATWNITQAQIYRPCFRLSDRLEDSLESIGIPVTICCGWDSPDNYTSHGHMYIRVYGIPIDSTSLLIWVWTYQGYDYYQGEWSDMEDYLEDFPSHRDVLE